MLLIALVLFVLAAFGGITMLFMVETRRSLPYWLAGIHGLLAAGGVIALILTILSSPEKAMAIASFIAFILAALGGGYILAFQLRGKPQPLNLIVVHGVVALIGIGLLLLAILY